jgi:hypothetical protein
LYRKLLRRMLRRDYKPPGHVQPIGLPHPAEKPPRPVKEFGGVIEQTAADRYSA